MAINQHEVSLKIAAKNEASKTLKQAADDLGRFEDAIKAGGAALDGHTGDIRKFGEAAKNVFKPLPGIAKETVDKLTGALGELEAELRSVDEAMSLGDKNLGALKKTKAAIDAETEALNQRKAAQRAADKDAADAAKARKDQIAAEVKDARAVLRETEKRIAAEDRLQTRVQKRIITNRKALEESVKISPARRDKLEVESVNLANQLRDSRNRKAQLIQAKAAGEAAIQPIVAEQQAHKDLTDAAVREAKERIAAINAEVAEISKRDRVVQASIKKEIDGNQALLAQKAALAGDKTRLAGMRERAVQIQSQLKTPSDVRRVAAGISDAPGRNARGMTALTEQTRRAADAQRLLNGEVKKSGAGFSSAKSYLMGLVSAYALYATATTQASKAIEAFKTKQAFEITVSNTLGGDMTKAAGEFDYLTDAANKYGFAISSISGEYAKLAATARGIGRSDKDIRTMFEGVLSVGRVNNLSDEKMQDAFRAVTQILSKNQVMSEELKGQLAEALPGAVVRFAKSQGFGPDQMKEFAAALESGSFAARDIIEYAQQELNDNANAVLRAQNTYQATMARFQNTLFKARTDFAENGFMDGLTKTIRELDEFFKSDDGKAYLIRLGEGAQIAVDAIAMIAKNLDKIVALAGVAAMAWGGSKIGAMFSGVAAAATSAAAGIGGATAAATGASRAVTVLGAGLRGLMGLLGGIPGIAMIAAGAIWSFVSSKNAEAAAEAQSRMERIRDVIGEIRSAAVDAAGDVNKFVGLLKNIGEMTGTEQMSLKIDISKAKQDIRDEVTRTYAEAMRGGNAWGMDLFQAGSLINKGHFDSKALNQQLDAISKANPAATEYVVTLQRLARQMAETEQNQDKLTDAIKATNGDTEAAARLNKSLTTENRNLAEAAALAATSQKNFEDALSKAGDEAEDTSGYREYDNAMKKVASTKKELIDLLNKWVSDQKASGNAVPADEIQRRMEQIQRATKEMADAAAADLQKVAAEASGMTVALSDAAAQALAAKEQMSQFTQTPLDPLGTVTGSRKYGSNKANIAQGIIDTAVALGIDPQVLATVISYETGGTFDPTKRGPTTQHGQHRGLIQFGEPQAAKYGVNWNDPVNSQLGVNKAIHKYMIDAGVKPGMGLLDVYSAVNAGRVGRYNASDANNGGAPGTVRDKVNDQMGAHKVNARDLLSIASSGSVAISGLPAKAAGTTQAAQAALSALISVAGDLKVISGHRDPEHNARVKGAKNSQHIDGKAYDVDVAGMSIEQRKRLITQARSSGFRGIGVYDNSLHFDVGGDRAWGPDRTSASIPEWAKDVVRSQIGSVSQTRDERTAINVGRTLAKEFSDDAMDVFDQFAIKVPSAISTAMDDAMADGDAQRVADLMRQAGEQALANEFLAKNQINAQTKAAEAIADAHGSIKQIIDGADFSQDELKNDASRNAAIARETAKAISELTSDGQPLNRVMRTGTDAEARAAVQSQVSAKAQAEWGEILREQERDRLEKAQERVKTDQQSIRDSQQAVELAKIENEEARKRQEIMNSLLNEEADGEFKRTDAERNAIAEAQYRAWDAETAKQRAEKAKSDAEKRKDESEKVHTNRIAGLQEQLGLLNDQLADAVTNRDFEAQDRLKGEINGVTSALLEAIDAAIAFNRALGGPEADRNIAALERQKLEIGRNTQALAAMSPEVIQIAGTIEGALNGAVSSFAERVARGENAWQALKASVAQAIGEILINIGKMITQAVIANYVMGALGLPSSTIPNPTQAGPLTGVATGLGNMISGRAAAGGAGGSGGFFQQVLGFFGSLFGGRHHTGGVVGDPAHGIDFIAGLANLKAGERPIIALDGEEVLTRNDPRHRANIGASIARMSRFHTGGVIGAAPDLVGMASRSAGVAGRMVSDAATATQQAAVNIINTFDSQEFMDRALATPTGERAILNVVGKNRSKLKGAFG